MNILYLSTIRGATYSGPTYSVPKQIEAQSKIDNVFWYNMVAKGKEEWQKLPYYHNLSEFPERVIKNLPAPFNKPDLIVIECFYNIFKSRIAFEIFFGNIPYIIVPRSELTKRGQERKKLKKQIANILACKIFAQRALAIHYLTKQEKLDSDKSWNKNAVILPNGVDIPKNKRDYSKRKGINCLFIGRIEPYQKGLDILIEACSMLRDKLEHQKCVVSIYGPDRYGDLNKLKKTVEEKQLTSIIKFYDGIYGEEKKKVILENDVFLIPSRFEGHPMALIEALSYGLPAVATLGSNMKDEIEKYDAGWTAENTVESFTKALDKMLAEELLYTTKGKNARELSKNYNWDSIAEKTHVEYKKLLELY